VNARCSRWDYEKAGLLGERIDVPKLWKARLVLMQVHNPAQVGHLTITIGGHVPDLVPHRAAGKRGR